MDYLCGYKTCPLLKEYAISYFVHRSGDLVQSESFAELNKSPALMKELMVAMASKPDPVRASNALEVPVPMLAVNDLRNY